MKNKLEVIVCLFLIIFTVGCNKTSNLNEKLIIKGIGVDLEDSKYKLCVSVVKSGNFAGSDDEDSDSSIVLESKGDTIFDAVNSLRVQTGSEPLFSQNLILIIGEDAAKSGVSLLMDFFINYYECRPSVEVMVCKGQATEILNFKENEEIINPKNITSMLIQNHFVENRYNIKSFVSDLQDESISAKLPTLEIKEGKLSINELAVFIGDKLTGFMNKSDKDGLLLTLGQLDGSMEPLLEGTELINYEVKDPRSKIEWFFRNKSEFDLNINLEVNIYGQCNLDQNQLKNCIVKCLKSKVKSSINRAVFELNSDVFKFSKYVVRKNPNYLKDHENVLKESNYNVNIYPNLRIIGKKVVNF